MKIYLLVFDSARHTSHCFPTMPIKMNPARSREHWQQGLDCYFSGDRTGAIKHGRLALVTNIKWSRPHWLLGMVYSVMEPIDREEAIREYRELVRKEPMWASGHYLLGRTLALQGRRDEALAPLRQALRMEPESIVYRTELARCLLKSNDYREAIAVLRGRPSLSPFYTIADAYLMLAQTIERQPSIAAGAVEIWTEILTFDESIPTNRPAIAEARKRIDEPNRRVNS